MQMGNGDGDGNGDGNRFRNSMQEAITNAQANALATQISKFVGGVTGFMFSAFVVPFLIVYAFNGLQPAIWPDISYLPTVAGLFVFRTLVHMLRSE